MATEDYPLVTFALFAYNQETLIADAMNAALAQDYGHLEVIVSDDCSTDGTWKVIESIADQYRGPHALRVVRNESNMGIGPHVGNVGMLARGDLIVVAAGDDFSVPERVSRIVETWIAHGRPEGALHSSVLVRQSSDDQGIRSDGAAADPAKATLEYFVKNHFRALCVGAAAAYTKGLFTRFPPLQTPFEDITLTFRALLIGNLMYVDAVLVHYHFNESSISRHLRITDRARVRKWFDVSLKNAEGMSLDYDHYVDVMKIIPCPRITDEFRSIKRRRRVASGLGEVNPIRFLVGMASYPYDVTARQWVGFYLRFFGFK